MVLHSDEVPEFHKFGCLFVVAFQLAQRFMHSKELISPLFDREERSREFKLLCLTAAFLPLFSSGVIYENSTHCLGSSAEKMGAALPVWSLVARESQVRFIDEIGCLQGDACPLPAQLSLGYCSEFCLDQAQQIIHRLRVALPELVQQL